MEQASTINATIGWILIQIHIGFLDINLVQIDRNLKAVWNTSGIAAEWQIHVTAQRASQFTAAIKFESKLGNQLTINCRVNSAGSELNKYSIGTGPTLWPYQTFRTP